MEAWSERVGMGHSGAAQKRRLIMIDKTQLISSIQAGEDTKLALKEVVFRGERIAFAREEGRAAAKLAEVFVSMANTEGGMIVMGVRDSDRTPVWHSS